MKLYTKLLLSYSVLFVVLMVSVSLFQYGREKEFRREQLNTRLEAYNDIIYHNLELISGDMFDMDSLLCLMPDTALRVSVIDKAGKVIYDSSADIWVIENHLSREEIVESNQSEFGWSVRRSTTDGVEYYYFAQRFGDVYVRTALPYNVTLVSALEANMDFMYFFAIALLVVMILLFVISDRLSESVKNSEVRNRRELTQNVAHELKTPVAAILGYMESLISNPDIDRDKQNFFIERTYHQSQRLAALLEDISMLNRLTDSNKLYEKEDIDVVSVVYEVMRDTSEAAAKRNVKVDIQLPPNIILHGNRSLLYSIFRNLIDNSIAYAGEGVIVEVMLSHSDSQYHYFTVRDNGVGVATLHLEHLFERFYRIDKGRSRKLGGTGLGLAIVKNAVLFHNGKIKAKSVPTGGLEFDFSLHR
ncbi:MAG: ATP-binding protein [Paludibacteraceae bacterium]|nr:ATP-binding protein [Paludibacteraceae bacterium]